MSSADALRLIVAFGVLLFLMRPISGLLLDLLKIMLLMGLVGLVLQVIPLDFIDKWSQSVSGWAHISSVYFPVIALLALVGLTAVSIPVISGSVWETVLKVFFYTVGGVFTAGSAEWIAWERSVGDLVGGALGIAYNALLIFGKLINP